MDLFIKTLNKDLAADSDLQELLALEDGRRVLCNLSQAAFSLDLPGAQKIYLFGEVFYYIQDDGNIKLLDQSSSGFLSEAFASRPLHNVIAALEGQYFGVWTNAAEGTVKIFSDRLGRLDSFHAAVEDDFYFATDLDFIFRHTEPKYDQKMLAHLFYVYGWYTPKGLTIYENVKQLGVGEVLTISRAGVGSEKISFKPLEIADFAEQDLEAYYNILRESVLARANRDGTTWISSSSGWDSTMLLALIVDEFGPSKAGMVTGRGKISERAEIINKFEVDKVKKIGEFFGLEPEVVDYDHGLAEYLGERAPYFKARHMYTHAGIAHYSRISDRVREAAGPGQTVLNGETSDSLHNFGFSQFVTFFHTSKAFTEYGDKMNCYLYGPSFFKKVLDGSFEKDRVFLIFQKMHEHVEFARPSGQDELIESYLFPFIYGSPRIPFAKNSANAALTGRGQAAVYAFPFREYMPEILSGLSDENIYSWLINLYHSFHSQGCSVNVQKHAMAYNEHKWRMPYHDMRLADFLSRAPEKWGRGLDFNHTKYPLKWVAENKVKFPYGLLDEGPHSYLYDVIEGFSIPAEFTYRSDATSFFKEAVKNKPYRQLLTDEYFDLDYLDGLVDDFLNGQEVSGADFNNLLCLITLCTVGWY